MNLSKSVERACCVEVCVVCRIYTYIHIYTQCACSIWNKWRSVEGNRLKGKWLVVMSGVGWTRRTGWQSDKEPGESAWQVKPGMLAVAHFESFVYLPTSIALYTHIQRFSSIWFYWDKQKTVKNRFLSGILNKEQICGWTCAPDEVGEPRVFIVHIHVMFGWWKWKVIALYATLGTTNRRQVGQDSEEKSNVNRQEEHRVSNRQ